MDYQQEYEHVDDHSRSIEVSVEQIFLQLDEETQKELIDLLRFLSLPE